MGGDQIRVQHMVKVIFEGENKLDRICRVESKAFETRIGGNVLHWNIEQHCQAMHAPDAERRLIDVDQDAALSTSWPLSHCCRARLRWTLPLVVFGTVPTRTSATR